MSLTIIILLVAAAVVVEIAAAQSGENCTRFCGGVEIPYPFGMSPECRRDKAFEITCNKSDPHPRPFIGNIPVTKISTDNSTVHVKMPTARICNGNDNDNDETVQISLEGSSYTISDTNRLMAIGCNVKAELRGFLNGQDFMFGCLSYCTNLSQVEDGICSGIGCCRTHIPRGITVTEFTVSNFFNNSNASRFSPCGYALLVDRAEFVFRRRFVSDFNGTEVPLKMDWSVGNKTCEVAKKKANSACGDHSECRNSIDGSGYVCKCLKGFEGNPYSKQGCQDINECEVINMNQCTQKCTNTDGGYNCSCFEDYIGDGRRDGEGCQHLPLIVRDKLTAIKIIVAAVVSFIATVLAASWMFIMLKKRRLFKLREDFFKKNGGFILQQQLSSHGGPNPNSSFKIFSSTELKNATQNFHESTVLGKGGFGTVHKGVLSDGKVIAIKKSNSIDQTQIQQFINEVIVLSQINHRNIIKLLGCCLETRVPLLVYEFAPNGTLFSCIHGPNSALLPWDVRLRIASETADALSYLHFATSMPIIHRDVKSTNILLDEGYVAKVCDFGASKFFPVDQTQLATVVQGTLGYLDPEYLQTNQLTEKSDVYSFGVVLVELLTGLVPLSYNRSQEERCLAMMFLYYLRENKLFEIVESHIAKEENVGEIEEVGEIARRCLSIKGDERPTMKEVAIELEEIFMKNRKRKGHENDELRGATMEAPMAETSKTFACEDDGVSNVEYDSMKNHGEHQIKDGR